MTPNWRAVRSRLRVPAILAGTALCLWISLGVTLNFTAAERFPSVARQWWPAGVTAKVANAAQVLRRPSGKPEDFVHLRAELRDAALREPVSSYALGMIGAVASSQNDQAGARQFFHLSESMSRRNLLTQMWLIEDAVAREDVPGAIRHYDRVMKASTESRDTLLPVLVSAASDPLILKNLLPILKGRPLWWPSYVRTMAEAGNDPGAMNAVLKAIRPDLENFEERKLAQSIVSRMIALNAERQAIATANQMEKIDGERRTLKDGDFENSDGLLPFAWSFRNDQNIRAFRDTVPTGSNGVWIVSYAETAGDAAQQLIGLAPGRYIFKGTAGDVPDAPLERPEIFVRCEQGSILKAFSLPAAQNGGRSFQFEFEVPRDNCLTQWVKLKTSRIGNTNTWLDDLSVTP